MSNKLLGNCARCNRLTELTAKNGRVIKHYMPGGLLCPGGGQVPRTRGGALKGERSRHRHFSFY